MKDMDYAIEKLPPQNIDAEQYVLGAVLLENEALYKAIEIISPADFYKDSHRCIFAAMLGLLDKSEPIDIITLADQLRRQDDIEKAGGMSYLSTVVNSVPTAANVIYHCKIIREKAILRGLIQGATGIISNIYEESQDADEMMDFAERTIFALSEQRMRRPFSKLDEVVKESLKMIERLYDNKEAVTGVASGFKDLDELTTGFQQGDLIIIGGRPSMGKTALCLNIAQHVGISVKEPVAIFSLEMSKRQLALRMLCSEAMVDSNRVRKGFLRQEDWPKLTSAAGRLAEAPIFIDDASDIGVLEMRSKARRLKMEHGLGMVIVDYLQLVRGRSGVERREQEISEISRSLKGLAKELNIPVIALSQLNRLVEQRRPPIPTIADLRESGAIEQDADVILFLYRDEVYNRDDPASKGKAELHVAKQRNGPAGVKVNLTFMSEITRFMDYTEGGYLEDSEEVF
ncbi:MAG: replicative DNA helicase [Candidatus Magnetominusculus sp. LBB02]|nr:replicative DNA helicase [Candidatus Magnetominusculus sp. LBB02]